MGSQWRLILALIFALVIGIFSVMNVGAVTVNYVFGQSEWPLIIIILSSVLMGALITGLIGIVRIYKLQREVGQLKRRLSKQEPPVSEEVMDSETFDESTHETTENDNKEQGTKR
ncbi:LapA family protein [Tuberibacillus sp. Marseille-P3662]|uniref:LapA family protein n=1 Tax=Tuberibacillus sp. Marseille-P3662 TaxID=1965358 RepID=UPI000A1CB098|nr:lipopolysaccharide assembly protein LapA domain-containing protein [Tuberibacillus sp. Marseille-P3662]